VCGITDADGKEYNQAQNTRHGQTSARLRFYYSRADAIITANALLAT
jgi:hypothetical protein